MEELSKAGEVMEPRECQNLGSKIVDAGRWCTYLRDMTLPYAVGLVGLALFSLIGQRQRGPCQKKHTELFALTSAQSRSTPYPTTSKCGR